VAFELHRDPGLPAIAASSIPAQTAVTWDVADVQRQALAIATVNVEPVGITRSVASSPGDGVTVYDDDHICRVTAAASLGAGADVGVVGATTSLGLVTAGASGVVKWRVGKSVTAAAAGETFSLHIKPRQLSGLLP
jgi:hypothetical protein